MDVLAVGVVLMFGVKVGVEEINLYYIGIAKLFDGYCVFCMRVVKDSSSFFFLSKKVSSNLILISPDLVSQFMAFNELLIC